MPIDGETPDSDLIDAARRGDEGAFDLLYRRYRDYVLIIAARFGATGDAGLDVLQETFFYFFRKMPDFELRARFSTFLYPVAKNLALKKKAEGKRLVAYENGGVDIAQVPSERGAEDPVRPFIEIVNTLPGGQRETLLLRFVDGMSLDEIAASLKIPLGTVKSRLHNALSALREQEKDPDS